MRTLVKTVAHGVKMQACATLLMPWLKGRPDKVYRRIRLIRTVAGNRALFVMSEHLALTALCGGRGSPVAAQIVHVDLGTGEQKVMDTDAAPPLVRAMLRFTMAAGSRDHAQAWAVWCSVPRRDRLGLAFGLVSAAGEHLKTHMSPDGEIDKAHTPQWTEDQL